MYKFIGLAMMGIFAMMVIPGNFDVAQGDNLFYGALTIVKHDSQGNEVFSQTVHNQLYDAGEDFILDQTFQDTVANADNVQIASICISDVLAPTLSETRDAAGFDTANGLTETNCIEDIGVGTASSIATIGPLTFTCAGTNCADTDTIGSIGICQARSASDAAFNDCATAGILFAEVDVTNTQLSGSETVDITYTFNLASASS